MLTPEAELVQFKWFIHTKKVQSLQNDEASKGEIQRWQSGKLIQQAAGKNQKSSRRAEKHIANIQKHEEDNRKGWNARHKALLISLFYASRAPLSSLCLWPWNLSQLVVLEDVSNSQNAYWGEKSAEVCCRVHSCICCTVWKGRATQLEHTNRSFKHVLLMLITTLSCFYMS